MVELNIENLHKQQVHDHDKDRRVHQGPCPMVMAAQGKIGKREQESCRKRAKQKKQTDEYQNFPKRKGLPTEAGESFRCCSVAARPR